MSDDFIRFLLQQVLEELTRRELLNKAQLDEAFLRLEGKDL